MNKKEQNCDDELKKITNYLVDMKKKFNIDTKNSLKNDYILFYRKILNDGNSFFRAFIFALIEGSILENNPTLFTLLS